MKTCLSGIEDSFESPLSEFLQLSPDSLSSDTLSAKSMEVTTTDRTTTPEALGKPSVDLPQRHSPPFQTAVIDDVGARDIAGCKQATTSFKSCKQQHAPEPLQSSIPGQTPAREAVTRCVESMLEDACQSSRAQAATSPVPQGHTIYHTCRTRSSESIRQPQDAYHNWVYSPPTPASETPALKPAAGLEAGAQGNAGPAAQQASEAASEGCTGKDKACLLELPTELVTGKLHFCHAPALPAFSPRNFKQHVLHTGEPSAGLVTPSVGHNQGAKSPALSASSETDSSPLIPQSTVRKAARRAVSSDEEEEKKAQPDLNRSHIFSNAIHCFDSSFPVPSAEPVKHASPPIAARQDTLLQRHLKPLLSIPFCLGIRFHVLFAVIAKMK